MFKYKPFKQLRMSTGKFKEVGKLTRAQSKRCLDATAPVSHHLLVAQIFG